MTLVGPSSWNTFHNDNLSAPASVPRLNRQARNLARATESSSPGSSATVMISGPDLALEVPTTRRPIHHAPSYELLNASHHRRPTWEDQSQLSPLAGGDSPAPPQPRHALQESFSNHAGSAELARSRVAASRGPTPPALRRHPPQRSATTGPHPTRRNGREVYEARYDPARRAPFPRATWPPDHQRSAGTATMRDEYAYNATQATLPSTTSFHRRVSFERPLGSDRSTPVQLVDDREHDTVDHLLPRRTGHPPAQQASPVHDNWNLHRLAYDMPPISQIDNRDGIPTQAGRRSMDRNPADEQHGDNGFAEECEGQRRLMDQPFPKRSLAVRDVEREMEIRKRAQVRKDARIPLPTRDIPTRWHAEPDRPTREQSVTPSFDGNASALSKYVGRPAAPTPPTPFTGTTSPTYPHGNRGPYMDANSQPPRYPGRMVSPEDGASFIPIQAPSTRSTPSVVGRSLDRPLTGRLSRLRARPPSSVSGVSEEPPDTESEGEEDEDDVWADEASDDELGIELHPDYIVDKATRRTRFESKMRSIVRHFRELDRATDATFFVFVSNPDQPHHTRVALSRGVRRHPNYVAAAQNARQGFAQVTDARRAERASRAKMMQHQYQRPSGLKGSSMGLSSSETAQSGWASSGTGSQASSLTLLHQVRMLQELDPSRMSAQELRQAAVAILNGMEGEDRETLLGSAGRRSHQ
ncbi:hypothetical protein CALVIDRAFT_596111 [Calocera viscosa TUFC12733]|uniref:Uncharacterized protein n=1 Tax=Calocera viscosa (strain TUFC12733) TaxID=1330018 RepID=A0A167Q8N2_CALVF|nr:hypothetical protein CALVIDRAFT_596111 [Calocera viscosa TUFC12733]